MQWSPANIETQRGRKVPGPSNVLLHSFLMLAKKLKRCHHWSVCWRTAREARCLWECLGLVLALMHRTCLASEPVPSREKHRYCNFAIACAFCKKTLCDSGNVQRKKEAMLTRQEMEAEELRQTLVYCVTASGCGICTYCACLVELEAAVPILSREREGESP